jgi:hypothetical protein
VSGDGSVTSLDALMILHAAAGAIAYNSHTQAVPAAAQHRNYYYI